jgi:DNA repair protein RecO (recombination protein O)
MEETFVTKALILKRQPWRECDSRVIIFSLDRGRLEFIARGAQKLESKLAGHLEPITLATIMAIKGKGFDYIGSAATLDAFLIIKSDLNKIYYAGRALAWLEKLTKEGEGDHNLFFLAGEYLDLLNKNFVLESKITSSTDKEDKLESKTIISTDKEDQLESKITSSTDKEDQIARDKVLFNAFLQKLISLLGFKPELYNCVNCGQTLSPNNNAFSEQKGGVLCSKCRNLGLPISDCAIKSLRFFVKNDLNKIQNVIICKEDGDSLERALNGFLEFHFS